MRLAFYGDDFTGSTDALEVLSFAGLRCALFLQVPSAALLEALGPFDAVGVAGHSRAMSPEEMDEQLPPVLAALAQLPVPLVHYKVVPEKFIFTPAPNALRLACTICR
jgi:uncharacterized protein YgbK (DUF1537 family)